MDSPQDPEPQGAIGRSAVALFGRCMLPGGKEFPCQACEAAVDSCVILCAYTPDAGDRIVVYVDHLGRLEGEVVHVEDHAFTMTVEGSGRWKDKLAGRIAWAAENAQYDDVEGRRHVRLEPQNRNSAIRLADGRSYPVEIMDISLSGAAVASRVRPDIGVEVTLSGMAGRVARHFEAGFAIEFEAGRQAFAFKNKDGEQQVTK